MKLIIALLLISFNCLAADNIYTAKNQGTVKIIDNANRSWPAMVNYTTDGNGNIVSMSSSLALPAQVKDSTQALINTLANVTTPLTCGNTQNLQLVISLGAVVTTVPALQLEGSEDGLTWFTIGSPLAGVASSTVSLIVNAVNARYVHAKVTTAGVLATKNFVIVKAF